MTVNHSNASSYADISSFGHHVKGNTSNAATEPNWMTMETAHVAELKAVEPASALQRQRAGIDQRADCSRDEAGSPIGYHHDMQQGDLPYRETSTTSQHTPSDRRIEPAQRCSPDMQDENRVLNMEPTKIPLPPFNGQPPAHRPSNVPDQLVPLWTVPSSISTGPPPVSTPWQNIPHVYTSRQLLPLLDGTGYRTRHQPDDKVVWLATFQARAYIICHPATFVELHQYLPVIVYGAEDCFHRLPDAETKTKMHGLDIAGLAPGFLPVISNARPARQEVAWVHGGAALRTPDSFRGLPCRDNRHYKSTNVQYEQSQSETDDDDDLTDNVRVSRASIPSCRRCARIAQAQLSSIGTTYISVVKSTQMQPGIDIQPPTAAMLKNVNHAINGVDIYRVVKSGSRDAAATQAFYNAGAHGLSTVFTCVVRGDIDWRAVAQRGVRRVEGLWGLVEDSDGPVPIFF